MVVLLMMTMKNIMAMPTVMPIRWPAPIRARELEAPRPVAPAPALNLK